MTTLSPNDDASSFERLLRDLIAAPQSFGPVLLRAGLSVNDFERLCVGWSSFSARRPHLASLGPLIRDALAVTAVEPARDIDELMGATLQVDSSTSSKPLPFEPHRGGVPAPIAASAAPPADDWGGTILSTGASPPKAPLPFKQQRRLTIEEAARWTAMSLVARERAEDELGREEISRATLESQDDVWIRTAIAESEGGSFALFEAYDAAYVRAIEDARGRITVDDYARIVVATERRKLEPTLASLRMPGAKYVHIERHFIARMSVDVELFRDCMNAIRQARKS